MIQLDLVILVMALAVSLLGFIPLFPFLETIPKLFLPCAALFSLVAGRRGFQVDHRIVTAGSVTVFLLYLARVTRADLVGPVVNLLVVLLGVRFLGERSYRNYLQIFLLALFCLAASSLYSLDVLFIVYLSLQVIILEIALVLLTCLDRAPTLSLDRRRFRALISVPLAMLGLSMPLLLLFFTILPRTQFPLWEFLANPAGHKTGFSETVQPGSAASVGEVKSVAFRAECEKLSVGDLYWRGIVLNRCDGLSWSRQPPPTGEHTRPGPGHAVTQRIVREPGASRYLVALDLPVQVSGMLGAGTSADYTLTRRYPSGKRAVYEVQSRSAAALPGELGVARSFYLDLPAGLSPWLREQGQRLKTSTATAADKLAAVEALFRDRQLLYATTALPTSQDPLVEFLTVKKRGHCEFFASSCGVLLRAAGVPARLVGGYLGGEYNALGGYYVVTEDRAHVWVEAYLDGQGWIRIDPSRWAVNAGEVGASPPRGLLRSLVLAADTLTYFWTRQVITYDLERQISLFNETGQRLRPAMVSRPVTLIRPLLLLALPLLFWWGWCWFRRRPSPEERLMTAFRGRLFRVHGVELSPGIGLHEATVTIADPAVTRFVALYSGAIYRDQRLTTEELRELQTLMRNFGVE